MRPSGSTLLGPSRPLSSRPTDGTAYYTPGGALPSYSVIPGAPMPGFLRKLDAAV